MTYEIDLSKDLYDLVADRYRPDHGPHTDPTFIVTSCAACAGMGYYDRDKAVQTYTDRIRDMYGRIGVRLSRNACTAYTTDGPHRSAAYAIRDRAMDIDVLSIVRAYKDDGWVVTPTGCVLRPESWKSLVKDMWSDGTIDIYSQVTALPGGTRQQIADAYAKEYKAIYGDTWSPYR